MGDYSAWKVVVGDNNPFAGKITAENFTRFTESHNLRQQADNIMTELGIEKAPGDGFHMGAHRGHGMNRGSNQK